MKILICNAGSTSLKFKLFDMPAETVEAVCGIERVGADHDSVLTYKNLLTGETVKREKIHIPDYRQGIVLFLDYLTKGTTAVLENVREIERVGFKVTLSKNHHGVFELTDEVLQGMEDWISLAPVHNRAYLNAVDVLRSLLPDAKFVGAFETAFHRTIPLERRLFGVPYEWYEKYGVERLGYHSASHSYIADVLNGESKAYDAISCHLGGSCSVCAIHNGESVDTSFGMSLESGLIHANRVGDMDPGMITFLKHEGLTDGEIMDGFQKNGGLKGISGVSGDLRYVEKAAAQGNERAKLAIGNFVSGIVHYIGAFYLDLGRLDTLVFTAGIGEHSASVRKMVCDRLIPIGVKLDEERNRRDDRVISAEDSPVRVLVIPTDEELGIVRKTYSMM